MTAIVSAIRIGGPLWLRTIIGRARESRAVAEEELTSSTSEDVCEIWNGTSVVRLVGSPRILQIVYLEDPSISQPEDRLLTLENGTKAGYRFQLATKKGALSAFTSRISSLTSWTCRKPEYDPLFSKECITER